MLQTRGILVHPEDLTLDWLDRMAEAGLNTLGLHPAGGSKAHETLQRAIDTYSEMAFLREEAAKRGITVEYEAHSMSWLLPRKLFSEQPSLFRMNEKGERVADFNCCCASSEALSRITEATAKLAKLLQTDSHRYHFWLDDVSGARCCCPECASLSPADQQLIIVNAMLTGLRTVDPEAKLCYLAYHDTLHVPQKVKPSEGVFLEYAPIRRDPHRPIFAPNCEKNVRESAALPELLDFFGRKDALVLEYWMDNSLYSHWTKPPQPFALDEEVMRQDVRFYQDLGFEHITSFGCYLGSDYDALYGKADLRRYGSILAQ